MPPLTTVARKARVDPRKLVGPMNPTHHPVRSGLYLRISPDTGKACWAHFDATVKKWGLFSDSKKGATSKRFKHSKKKLPWFAHVQP